MPSEWLLRKAYGAVHVILVSAMSFAPTCMACAQSISSSSDVAELRLTDRAYLRAFGGPDFHLYLIAQEAGILEKYNIELTRVAASVGGVAQIPIIVSGQAELGNPGVSAPIIGRSNGANVKAVAAHYITGDDFHSYIYFVRADSDIESPKGVEEKTLAIASIGSTPDIGFNVWALKNGVDPKKVRRVAIPYSNMTDALLNKQVDIIGLVSLFYVPFLRSNDGSKIRVLTKDSDGLPTGKLFTAVIFSEDYIDQNPKVIRALVSALKDALAFVRRSPEEARQILAKHFQVPSEKFEIPMWPDNLCLDMTAGAEWVDALERAGQIKPGVIKSSSEWMTNEFNPDCPQQ